MGKTIRCFEIEPPGSRTDVDSVLIPFKQNNTWETVLGEVEQSLDRQYSEAKDGDREWKDFGVKVGVVDVDEDEIED